MLDGNRLYVECTSDACQTGACQYTVVLNISQYSDPYITIQSDDDMRCSPSECEASMLCVQTLKAHTTQSNMLIIHILNTDFEFMAAYAPASH